MNYHPQRRSRLCFLGRIAMLIVTITRRKKEFNENSSEDDFISEMTNGSCEVARRVRGQEITDGPNLQNLRTPMGRLLVRSFVFRPCL